MSRMLMPRTALNVLMLCFIAVGTIHGQNVGIDDFENPAAWKAVPASGVEMRLGSEAGRSGRALRVDFDFHGGGGWAALRKDMRLTLPENYEISFWLKGAAPLNTLEFKLVDPSGENVWWVNRPEFEYAGDWRKITFKKRHVSFAWGPRGGGDLRDVGAVELAITAGTGGKGTIWLDDLVLTPREPVTAPLGPPIVTTRGHTRTEDLRSTRELGGIAVSWNGPSNGRDYDVQTSADGKTWQTVVSVRRGRRATDYLQMPEAETRFIRVVMLAGDVITNIVKTTIEPLEFGATRNKVFEAVAAQQPQRYPRYFSGTQTYWTVIGNPRDTAEALIDEQGAVEVGKRGFTLEPFLYADRALLTSADSITQSLERDHLPIPSVTRYYQDLELRTTAWTHATGVWIRYQLHNRSDRTRNTKLFVAIRPFQVNPTTQFLNTTGGFTPIRSITRQAEDVRVGSRSVIPLTEPSAFGAASFHEGDITDFLARGELPPRSSVTDSASASASGALQYDLSVAPHGVEDVYVTVPFDTTEFVSDPQASLQAAIAMWQDELDRFDVTIPRAPEINRALHTNLAYILINRDGAAIQPGSRSYERSWIRDGSLTSAALLRLGHAPAVKEFAQWFARFQYADGKVPCCVDHRGADPVPENDSHGQLIYLISEYFRYTSDTAFVREQYPHVAKAVAYIDSLRNSRRTSEYEGTSFWGLLPQSISHEGYSAKPMHSYWDDFFALKGLKDAVFLATVLRDSARVRAWTHSRDEFQTELMQSLRRAMQQHRIDYLPGAAELGDFDATSTTVGVTPANAGHDLPQPALARTFDKYWENFVARRDTGNWDGYTPYEWRVVGTFVRLGQRERAHALLDWFMQHQRPAAWAQWSEVVYRDRNAPHFIGDMPHTWVGSDFIRSVLDMFVYDEDETLVIGAGILPAWVERASDTTAVSNIRTPYGPVSFRVFNAGASAVAFSFAQTPAKPVNGYVVRSPLERPIRAARADGRPVPHTATEVRVPVLPRSLVLSY